ncbi:MAG: hypothetical protein ACJAUV_000956 [Flavobacteriales bacterium]|jgi:hypothetical protein
MKNKKSIISLIIGISLSACCTKKDCDQEIHPQIVIKHDGADNSD